MGLNNFVDFTTAKLLKEKGFDKICQNLWHFNSSNCIKMPNKNSENFGFSAPTIAEVVMWLYEKHGIWITVYTMDKWLPNGNDREQLFDYSLKQMKLGLIDIPKKPEEFSSPAEAYEVAIEYCLNQKFL